MIGEINTNKLKRDMMKLWKDTFHDSTRYIKLVFDTYFSPDNVFYVYDGEKLVAALLGVEYEFQALENDKCLNTFKGMYLCGLATHPEYRRKGIMARLMKEAEISAKARGFVMTFLIPADSQLREYYHKNGYVTASYKRCQVVECRKFENPDKLNIYTFKDFFDRGKYGFLSEIAQWCNERERPNEAYVTLKHSEKDFLTIMAENENSFFLTETSFDPEYPILAKLRGVVFPTAPDIVNRYWRIVGIFLRENENSRSDSNQFIRFPDEIRDAILSIHPEFKLEIILPSSGECRSLTDPYAMIKIISDDVNLRKYENQAYDISLMLD